MPRPDPLPAGGRPVVFRSEDFYTPPPGQPADAWQSLAPAERVIAWYEQKGQRRLPRPDGVLLGHKLYARIDAGRWVADCPCGSAQVVSPADPRMYCVECLTGWHQMVFPADPAAAEAAVAPLPPHERFWWQADDTAWNRPPAAVPSTKQQKVQRDQAAQKPGRDEEGV